MNTRERYRQLCGVEASIPIFSRDWWLDAVCGDGNWDVVLVKKGDRVIGSMPYFRRKRYGSTLLVQPPLTQKLGPWIRPSNIKYTKALSYEKDVLGALIEKLPNYGLFAQNWHHVYMNWLPFYWRGFEQTTRYSYILNDLADEEHLWKGLAEHVRRNIRKASGRFNVVVRDDLDLNSFLMLNRMTFARQGKQFPYPEALVERIDKACGSRNCRLICIAEDDQGRQHAGAYIVWDEHCAYYLLGGGDPDLRNSGAASLVLWEAIKKASRVTKAFDFEGSMIAPIERFFSGFGAQLVPYIAIRREAALVFRVKSCVRTLLGRR